MREQLIEAMATAMGRRQGWSEETMRMNSKVFRPQQEDARVCADVVLAFVVGWLEQWNHVMVEDGPVIHGTLVDEWKQDMA